MSLRRAVVTAAVVVLSTSLSPGVSGSALESRLAAEAQPFGGASEPGQIVDWLPTTTVLNKAKVKADPEVASDPPRYEMDHESGVGVPGHLILSLFGVALITIGLLRGKSRV